MSEVVTKKLPAFKALLYLFYIFIPVDMLSGALALNGQFPLSAAYKSFVLVAVSIHMIAYMKNIRVAALISCVFVWIALRFSMNGDLLLTLKDSMMLIKLTSIFIFLDFFKLAFEFGYGRQIITIVKCSYSFFVLNILLGILGYGNSMYSSNGISIGSKGFIYAGNELGVAFLSSFVLLLAIMVQHNRTRAIVYTSLSGFISAGVMTLKSALIGVLVVTLYIPYASVRQGLRGLRLKRSSAKTALIFLISTFIFCGILAIFVIPNIGIIDRWLYFFGKFDLLTFALSGRNVLADQALDVYLLEYNIWERLIGTGQQWHSLVPSQKFVEIDLIDFLMTYGVFGAVLMVFLPLQILFSRGVYKQNIAYSVVYISAWILFILSFVAGHVFNSGTAGYLISIVFSILKHRNTEAM